CNDKKTYLSDTVRPSQNISNSSDQALEVHPIFFENVLEKNAPEPFFCLNAYRYGFNGMEKDDEVKGKGNHVDFGARGYDPRLGRWLSVDPKTNSIAFDSPYG